jgi:hypothetical protein
VIFVIHLEKMDEIESFQSVDKPETPKIKRRSFNLLTKKRILEQLQDSSLTSLSKAYGVARGSLQLWKKQAEEINSSPGMCFFM